MAESTKPTEDCNNKDYNTNNAGESSKQGMYHEKDDRKAGYSLKNNKNPSKEQMDQTSTGAVQNVDDQSVSKGAVDKRLLGGLTPMKISVMFRTYTEKTQNGVNVVMVEKQGTSSQASRNSQKSFKKRGFGNICGTLKHSEDENIIKKIHIDSPPENFNCFEFGVPTPLQISKSKSFHNNFLEEILCPSVDGPLQDKLIEIVDLLSDTDDQTNGDLHDDDLTFENSTADTISSSTDSAESIDVDITRPESGVPTPVLISDSNGSSESIHNNFLEEILCASVDGPLQDQLIEIVELLGDPDDQTNGELPDDDLIFENSTADTIWSSTDSAESIDVDTTRPEETDQLQFYQNYETDDEGQWRDLFFNNSYYPS